MRLMLALLLLLLTYGPQAADTNFTNNVTKTDAAWFQDVNNWTYRGGTVPSAAGAYIFRSGKLQLLSSGSGSINFISTENLSTTRNLTLLMNSASRTLNLGGDLIVSSAATISGTNTGDQTDATLPFTDITTNNVSTTKHGFAPKLPNSASVFLNGIGTYTTPATGAIALDDLTDAKTNYPSRYMFLGQNSGAGASGVDNTMLGALTGASLTTGANNTATGSRALNALIDGGGHTALGKGALTLLANGDNNVAVGFSAMAAATSATGNTAVGTIALGSLTSIAGGYNTAVGYSTLFGLTTGVSNSAIGMFAGQGVTTGSNNVLIGENVAGNAGTTLTTGSNNILIGDHTVTVPTSGTSNYLNIGNAIVGNLATGVISTFNINSLSTAGTAGAGFFEALTQSSNPSSPASGFRLFANSTGALSWKRQSDGFVRTIDSTLTANRTYTLPDVTGTVALTSSNVATATSLAANQGTTTTILHGNAAGTPAFSAVVLTADVSGILPVANGGTNLASGTSGGVLAYTASGTLASSGALTANLPVIGGGAGAAPSVGTRSGNTTAYVTTTGTQTSGDCVKIDANGNHIANGSSCGGSGATTIDGLTDAITSYANGSMFLGSGSGSVATLGSATNSTFIGALTGQSLTTGIWNTAVGSNALKVVTTGTASVAIGYQALAAMAAAPADSNVAVGVQALSTLTAGHNNTAVGTQAMPNATNNNNTGIGSGILPSLSTGASNIAIGLNAGGSLTIGDRNIFIGNGTVSPATSTSDYMTIAETIFADTNTKKVWVTQHLVRKGTAPTITAGGGTSPTVAGRDETFVVTIGTGGTDLTFTATFATAFTTNPPNCVAQSDTDIVALKNVTTTSTVVVTATLAFTAGSKVKVLCSGWE